jgi:hypothetical protein
MMSFELPFVLMIKHKPQHGDIRQALTHHLRSISIDTWGMRPHRGKVVRECRDSVAVFLKNIIHNPATNSAHISCYLGLLTNELNPLIQRRSGTMRRPPCSICNRHSIDSLHILTCGMEDIWTDCDSAVLEIIAGSKDTPTSPTLRFINDTIVEAGYCPVDASGVKLQLLDPVMNTMLFPISKDRLHSICLGYIKNLLNENNMTIRVRPLHKLLLLLNRRHSCTQSTVARRCESSHQHQLSCGRLSPQHLPSFHIGFLAEFFGINLQVFATPYTFDTKINNWMSLDTVDVQCGSSGHSLNSQWDNAHCLIFPPNLGDEKMSRLILCKSRDAILNSSEPARIVLFLPASHLGNTGKSMVFGKGKASVLNPLSFPVGSLELGQPPTWHGVTRKRYNFCVLDMLIIENKAAWRHQPYDISVLHQHFLDNGHRNPMANVVIPPWAARRDNARIRSRNVLEPRPLHLPLPWYNPLAPLFHPRSECGGDKHISSVSQCYTGTRLESHNRIAGMLGILPDTFKEDLQVHGFTKHLHSRELKLISDTIRNTTLHAYRRLLLRKRDDKDK